MKSRTQGWMLIAMVLVVFASFLTVSEAGRGKVSSETVKLGNHYVSYGSAHTEVDGWFTYWCYSYQTWIGPECVKWRR